MENSAEKMHSMIISSVYQQPAVSDALKSTIAKYKFTSIQTLQDCVCNNSPTIISAKKMVEAKGGNSEIIGELLKLMLAKTARSFNVTRNIDTSQIPDVVEILESDFNFLKLSEVYFVFKQAKMGKFGKLYERIDVPTVIGWFTEHKADRIEYFEADSSRKHDAETAHERSRQYDDFVVTLQQGAQTKKENKVSHLAKSMAKKMKLGK